MPKLEVRKMLELQLRRETSHCELINPFATSSSIGSGGSGWAEGISSCDNEDNGKSSKQHPNAHVRAACGLPQFASAKTTHCSAKSGCQSDQFSHSSDIQDLKASNLPSCIDQRQPNDTADQANYISNDGSSDATTFKCQRFSWGIHEPSRAGFLPVIW